MKLRLGRALLYSAILITVVFFQNCSNMTLQDEVLIQQSLFELQESVDSEKLPQLLNSESLVMWRKYQQPSVVDRRILGNQFSVILVVDKNSSGNLMSLDSGTGSEEVSLSIVDQKIRFTRSNSLGTYFSETLEAPVPLVDEKMVIAASSGSKSGEMFLLVNGIIQRGEILRDGSPFDFSYIQKNASIKMQEGHVSEIIFFSGDSSLKQGRLDRKELNVMSRLLARKSLIENVLFDPQLIDEKGFEDSIITPVLNPYLSAVKSIMDSKCVKCHKVGGTSPDLSALKESTAISMGLIVKGNPESSPLYYRLKGSLGPGTKNMPLDGSLSTEELNAVANWINYIK